MARVQAFASQHRIGICMTWFGTASTLSQLVLFVALPVFAAQQPAKQASPEFQQVESLIEQGRLDEARLQMLDQIRRNPSSSEALILLGIIESSEQDYSNAVGSFEKALRLSPNSTKAHNNLGKAYEAQKKIAAAETQFRTVLRLDPGDRDGNYNLGVLLLARGQPTEALRHFERVRPANLATSLNIIRANFESKRTAEGLRMATEISAKNPDDVQVHFSLGLLLAAAKQYKPAQLELEEADSLRPGTFETLYNLGLAFLRNGDSAKAQLAADRALQLKPESAEALYLLAEVYANESRPLDALDLLVRAHKITPENTDIIFLMAQISISQDYFEDAIPLLESGVQIAPQRSDIRAALGESYFMAGKVDKAVETFKKLVEVEPTARSYAFLGLSYRHLGRFDEAKQYFQKGLKLDPHNVSCLFNLGFIAERQGESAVAETIFQQILKSNSNYPDALLELANIRIVSKRLPEAAELLKKYVKVSRDPSTGYYKLAMVERSLHDTAAADRDLHVFQTLSKDVPAGPYPYEHLFDYLDNRSKLSPGARTELDLNEITEDIKKHPGQPEDLYLLAENYLKTGNLEAARTSIEQLDKISAGDYRTLTGVGVLLARYRIYDDAIQHFQSALQANPDSDEVKFDLANAYFRKGLYSNALGTASQVSESGQKDDAFLALLGDIYTHLGDTARATEIFENAIERNPDNDQGYLALCLLQLRQSDIAGAKQTLLKGQARIPGSGKLAWGLGLASALEGRSADAAGQFERAVEMMPEWPGTYSTLGVFYFQTGQIAKAREVLDRFKNSNAHGGLDVNKIEQALASAPETASTANQPMSLANRQQLLQLALAFADKTL